MAEPVPPTWRKPAGILAILVYVLVWCVAIASLSSWVGNWPVLVQLVFYLAAGIVWIAPLKPALRWMETGSIRPKL